MKIQGNEETFPPIYWEIINEEVAKEFFGECKKILISSEYGNLAGFRERFKNMLDITVYDDSILEQYLAGEFDMLIYGIGFWFDTPIIKYNAKQVYATLLAEQVRRYLKNYGVHLILLENYGKISNKKNKIKFTPINNMSSTFDGIYNDYFINGDMSNGEICNSVNGIRRTTETPKSFKRSIYFFGHCPILGNFVSDDQTIESHLQRIINQNNISCKVFNCGVHGNFPSSSINHLYQIMDMNFNSGDIILDMNQGNITSNIYRIAFRENMQNYISLTDAFRKTTAQNVKFLADGLINHLNAEGNKIIAEFLFDKLYYILSEENENSHTIVHAMFSNLVPPPVAA